MATSLYNALGPMQVCPERKFLASSAQGIRFEDARLKEGHGACDRTPHRPADRRLERYRPSGHVDFREQITAVHKMAAVYSHQHGEIYSLEADGCVVEFTEAAEPRISVPHYSPAFESLVAGGAEASVPQAITLLTRRLGFEGLNGEQPAVMAAVAGARQDQCDLTRFLHRFASLFLSLLHRSAEIAQQPGLRLWRCVDPPQRRHVGSLFEWSQCLELTMSGIPGVCCFGERPTNELVNMVAHLSLVLSYEIQWVRSTCAADRWWPALCQSGVKAFIGYNVQTMNEIAVPTYSTHWAVQRAVTTLLTLLGLPHALFWDSVSEVASLCYRSSCSRLGGAEQFCYPLPTHRGAVLALLPTMQQVGAAHAQARFTPEHLRELMMGAAERAASVDMAISVVRAMLVKRQLFMECEENLRILAICLSSEMDCVAFWRHVEVTLDAFGCQGSLRDTGHISMTEPGKWLTADTRWLTAPATLGPVPAGCWLSSALMRPRSNGEPFTDIGEFGELYYWQRLQTAELQLPIIMNLYNRFGVCSARPVDLEEMERSTNPDFMVGISYTAMSRIEYSLGVGSLMQKMVFSEDNPFYTADWYLESPTRPDLLEAPGLLKPHDWLPPARGVNKYDLPRGPFKNPSARREQVLRGPVWGTEDPQQESVSLGAGEARFRPTFAMPDEGGVPPGSTLIPSSGGQVGSIPVGYSIGGGVSGSWSEYAEGAESKEELPWLARGAVATMQEGKSSSQARAEIRGGVIVRRKTGPAVPRPTPSPLSPRPPRQPRAGLVSAPQPASGGRPRPGRARADPAAAQKLASLFGPAALAAREAARASVGVGASGTVPAVEPAAPRPQVEAAPEQPRDVPASSGAAEERAESPPILFGGDPYTPEQAALDNLYFDVQYEAVKRTGRPLGREEHDRAVAERLAATSAEAQVPAEPSVAGQRMPQRFADLPPVEGSVGQRSAALNSMQKDEVIALLRRLPECTSVWDIGELLRIDSANLSDFVSAPGESWVPFLHRLVFRLWFVGAQDFEEVVGSRIGLRTSVAVLLRNAEIAQHSPSLAAIRPIMEAQAVRLQTACRAYLARANLRARRAAARPVPRLSLPGSGNRDFGGGPPPSGGAGPGSGGAPKSRDTSGGDSRGTQSGKQPRTGPGTSQKGHGGKSSPAGSQRPASGTTARPRWGDKPQSGSNQSTSGAAAPAREEVPPVEQPWEVIARKVKVPLNDVTEELRKAVNYHAGKGVDHGVLMTALRGGVWNLTHAHNNELANAVRICMPCRNYKVGAGHLLAVKSVAGQALSGADSSVVVEWGEAARAIRDRVEPKGSKPHSDDAVRFCAMIEDEARRELMLDAWALARDRTHHQLVRQDIAPFQDGRHGDIYQATNWKKPVGIYYGDFRPNLTRDEAEVASVGNISLVMGRNRTQHGDLYFCEHGHVGDSRVFSEAVRGLVASDRLFWLLEVPGLRMSGAQLADHMALQGNGETLRVVIHHPTGDTRNLLQLINELHLASGHAPFANQADVKLRVHVIGCELKELAQLAKDGRLTLSDEAAGSIRDGAHPNAKSMAAVVAAEGGAMLTRLVKGGRAANDAEKVQACARKLMANISCLDNAEEAREHVDLAAALISASSMCNAAQWGPVEVDTCNSCAVKETPSLREGATLGEFRKTQADLGCVEKWLAGEGLTDVYRQVIAAQVCAEDARASVETFSRVRTRRGLSGGPLTWAKRTVTNSWMGCGNGLCFCRRPLNSHVQDHSSDSRGGTALQAPTAVSCLRDRRLDARTLHGLLMTKRFRIINEHVIPVTLSEMKSTADGRMAALVLQPSGAPVDDYHELIEEVVMDVDDDLHHEPEDPEPPSQQLGGMPIHCTEKMGIYATEHNIDKCWVQANKNGLSQAGRMGLLLWASGLPPSLSACLKKAGWCAIPAGNLIKAHKSVANVVRRSAMVGTNKAEHWLCMRKLPAALARTDDRADFDKDLWKRVGRPTHKMGLSEPYYTAFRREAELLASECYAKVRKRSDWKPWRELWAERAVRAPNGASSMAADVREAGASQDDHAVRPSKKLALSLLSVEDLEEYLRARPLYLARASTKMEPGLKARALYATGDLASTVCGYVLQGCEGTGIAGGMCPSQRPEEIGHMLEVACSMLGGVHVAADYDDYNNLHTLEELHELYMSRARALNKFGSVGEERAELAEFIASCIANSVVKVGNELHRVASGLFSGSRGTTYDNTSKHEIDRKIALREATWLGYRGWQSGASESGDDEYAKMESDVDAAAYLTALRLTGHRLNAAKQMVGKHHSEYLQRCLSRDACPRQSLASILGTLTTGNWYRPSGVWLDSVFASCVNNWLEAHRRGLPRSVAARACAMVLDQVMRLGDKTLPWRTTAMSTDEGRTLFAGCAFGATTMPDVKVTLPNRIEARTPGLEEALQTPLRQSLRAAVGKEWLWQQYVGGLATQASASGWSKANRDITNATIMARWKNVPDEGFVEVPTNLLDLPEGPSLSSIVRDWAAVRANGRVVREEDQLAALGIQREEAQLLGGLELALRVFPPELRMRVKPLTEDCVVIEDTRCDQATRAAFVQFQTVKSCMGTGRPAMAQPTGKRMVYVVAAKHGCGISQLARLTHQKKLARADRLAKAVIGPLAYHRATGDIMSDERAWELEDWAVVAALRKPRNQSIVGVLCHHRPHRLSGALRAAGFDSTVVKYQPDERTRWERIVSRAPSESLLSYMRRTWSALDEETICDPILTTPEQVLQL